MTKQETKLVQTLLATTLVKEIDEYQKQQGFTTRTAAIVNLINKGLGK